jgi:hypothetical protein
MAFDEHQRELLRLNPGLDPRDVPQIWHGAADLDSQIEARKAKRLAAKAPSSPTKVIERHMTSKDCDAISEAIAGALVEYCEPLVKRIAALETRPVLSPRGPWKPAKAYAVGDAASHQGGLWMCVAPTQGARPGASAHWKLIVKSGAFREAAK